MDDSNCLLELQWMFVVSNYVLWGKTIEIFKSLFYHILFKEKINIMETSTMISKVEKKTLKGMI